MADEYVQSDVEKHGKDPHQLRGGLEAIEDDTRKPAFYLNTSEMKLLGIAGIGFFIDAYDLFIINQVSVMLQWRLYGGASLPANLEGFMKAGANIGSVIGQFGFGYLADALGRKAVYGKELMLIIFATILCICAPTNVLPAPNVLIWIACWRIVLGIGVGGDYPMSSSVTSDRALVRKRGTMLAYVFAFQGWGSLVGSLVTMITLLAYKSAIEAKGSRVDGTWRVIVGLALIPAFGTLYQRLTLPESTRYEKSKSFDETDSVDSLDMEKKKEVNGGKVTVNAVEEEDATSKKEKVKQVAKVKKAHWAEFAEYFGEWRHAKNLIATCVCWFLLDVAFYGINLNQSVVLAQIHFAGKNEAEWPSLFHIATGNLIITALGFVPGYYVTVLTIEYIGRKPIQIGGFLMAALFLAILAGKFTELSIPAFVVCFALLQFFFNFGANSTTYIYPAEVFPTRVKATAHGISAASGKAGAIVSAFAFNTASQKLGTPKVLWIFFACCVVGAIFTLLLPEVKGRDADLVDEEERRAARIAAGGGRTNAMTTNGTNGATNGTTEPTTGHISGGETI